MSKNKISKTIKLSFDLSRFLIDNPSVAKKYETENFVVFTEGDKLLNESSDTIVRDMKKKGKDVVKATRKSGTKNNWHLEFLAS